MVCNFSKEDRANNAYERHLCFQQRVTELEGEIVADSNDF